ncbi:MAG: sulfite exporter TauE/SafE family protein [Chloroflexota bacterium]
MQNLEIFSAPWFLICGVVLVASFIRGISGFGFALITAPILLLLMSPKEMVATNLLLGFIGQIWIVYRTYRYVDWRRILPMMLASLLGIPLGTFIINTVPQDTLKIAISIVIFAFAVPLALGYRRSFGRERVSAGIAGFLSGVLITSTSLGGPPIVLFLHNQDWPKEKIYPSLAAQFMAIATTSLVVFAFAGNITPPLLLNAVSLAPVMFIGINAGMILFRRVNPRFFRLFSMFVVIGAAIMGILSGFGVLS